ncbi:MAG: PqqD family protein [Nocardioidaceae bacterium]|nr:PqqD family protein [Nocardioidaceae bacterium]MCL2613886.1 PqqD family protein [Nocardioidaceae bacterium]
MPDPTERAERWTRHPDLSSVEMDGEIVMMGADQGEYFALRGVAASLWRHLDEPHDLDELCVLVADEYDVTPVDCRADVAAFLAQLRAKRMLLAA